MHELVVRIELILCVRTANEEFSFFLKCVENLCGVCRWLLGDECAYKVQTLEALDRGCGVMNVLDKR